MSKELAMKPSLAALALRLSLGAILLYSGLEKIAARDSRWGVSWADVLWHQRGELPQSTETALRNMLQAREKDDEARKALLDFRSDLKAKHAAAVGAMPEALGYYAVQLAVAWGELLAGVALLLGLLTRLAALGVLIIQIGAVATVTWASGFSFKDGGGWGYNLAILGMCLALLCLGSGQVSLSGILKRKRQSVPQEQPQPPTPVAV